MSDPNRLAAENQLLLRIAELLVADGATNLGERDGKLRIGIGHREFEIAALSIRKMSPENAAIYHGDIDGDFNL